MHVNDVEINGFAIDEFNVYKLEVGKTQGICPLCSHDRKPKNRKAKCASYDWERGLGTCHNCNNTFQFHTYKRKGNKNKDYVLDIFAIKYSPVETAGPIPKAKITVPIPMVPPRDQPILMTVSSKKIRTQAIGRPVTL